MRSFLLLENVRALLAAAKSKRELLQFVVEERTDRSCFFELLLAVSANAKFAQFPLAV